MNKRNTVGRLACWVAAVWIGLAGTGWAANIAFQATKLSGSHVAPGNNVIFDTIIFSAGNISYNSVTGVITFNETGRYLLDYSVAYQQFVGSSAIVAISSSQGDHIPAESTSPAGQLIGNAIIEVGAAPVTVTLLSQGTLIFPGSVGIKASLRVVQDDILP